MLDHCSRQLRKWRTHEQSVCCEAFSNAYPEKEVPNKTTIHQLVTTFFDTGSVCDRKYVRHRTVLTDETLLNVAGTLARLLLKSEEIVVAKWNALIERQNS
jgi:hypothetical protein